MPRVSRRSSPSVEQSPPTPLDAVQQRTLTTRDGVTISYEVLGQGPRTLMLANGLGGRLYSWEPLLRRFWSDYRIITWDYRGLFGSPYSQPAHMSVRDHADDALQVLDAEGVDRAVWVGWSMGVQVVLEAASLQPNRFAGLVLLNGTYGHVFSTALQPAMRVPWLPRYMHGVLEWVRRHPPVANSLAQVTKRGTIVLVGMFWLVLGARALQLRPLLQQYTEDIYRPENFPNYLRLFQELDAHSAYHHLPRIRVPALVVSGRFDPLTPAYQSREMARRLRDCDRLHVRKGSHFVLIERPETVVPAIDKFLKQRALW